MENNRLNQLKEKYKDKTLSRSERQRVLEEIARERYRLDPRKTITIHELSKTRLIMGIMSFIACSSVLFLNRFNIPDSKPLLIAVIVFALICLVLFVYSVIPLVTKKCELSDELSKQNELKASQFAFMTIAFIMFVLAFIYSIFGSGSFKVYASDMYWLVCIYAGLHTFIKEIYFLHFDKAEPDTEEE